MTSQINPNNIDGAYPVAGQDNNSQGFRDNFTNTATNFQYAAAEITDLQSKVVLKAALTGTTLNNDMLGSVLSNAVLSDMAVDKVAQGNLSGTITVDYTAGQVQTVTPTGNISLVFTNWPAADYYGWVMVQITVTNPSYTVQLPLAVNAAGVQGAVFTSGVGYTLNFAVTGVYTFTFSTVNAGTNITITDSNKQLQPYNNSSDVWSSGLISLATTTTLFPTGGPNTATLPDGINGQIKVLVQSGITDCLLTVASPGWDGAGTIELTEQGEAVTLQFITNAWYCIGNNGALLA